MNAKQRKNWAQGTSGSPAQKGPASWRGEGKKKGAGDGTQARKPWWRTGGSHEPIKHTVRLILWSGAVVILGLALYLIIPKHKQTPFIAVVVADYDSSSVPPNAMAQEDVSWFSKLWARHDKNGKHQRTDIGFWGDAGKVRCLNLQDFFQSLSDQTGGQKFRPGGPNRDTVLMYISAHGAVDSKGSPCLLLSDADPHDDSTWLPLEKLLNEITSRFDASKVNDKPVKKVVFLDATRMLYDLNLGLLYNGFNEQLEAAVKANDDPYLVVVNASSSGEVSWPAPNYGGTIFGHFVGQGLSGLVENTDRDSDVVSLGELTDYLKSNVPAWVLTYRAALQHPIVIPVGTDWQDWEVARTSTESRTAAEEVKTETSLPAEVRKRAKVLDAIWQRYDVAVDEKEMARLAPLALAELQFRLVRLEQMVLAGQAYQSKFDTLAEDTSTLLNQLGDTKSTEPATVLNAPSAVRAIPPQKLQEFVTQWNASPDVGQWKEVNFSRDVVSPGMIRWLLDRKAALGSLTLLDNIVKMIDAAPLTLSPANKSAEDTGANPLGPGTPELVEVQLLRMLNKYVDREAVSNPQPVEEAILARCLAEQAASPADERVHYWVRARVNLADQQRRLAEDRLLVGTSRAIDDAQKTYKRLLDETDGLYRLAEKDATQLAQAYEVRDTAWSKLPHLAKWLMVKATQDRSVMKEDFVTLANLADKVQELGELLDQPFTPSTGISDQAKLESLIKERSDSIGQIQTLRDEIAKEVETFEKEYQRIWQEKGIPQNRDRTMVGLWTEMLQVPLTMSVSRGESGTMRGKQRDELLKLVFAGDDIQGNQKSGGEKADAAAGGEKTAAPNLLDLLAQLEVHPVRSMLGRQGLVDLPEQSPGPKHPVDTPPDKILYLAVQSGQVRELLNAGKLVEEAGKLVSQLETDIATHSSVRQQRLNVSKADRLLRAAAGLTGVYDLYDLVSSGDRTPPTQLLEQLDSHYLLLWQAHRALLDLWNDDQDRYYLRVFDAYCDAAKAAYTLYEHPNTYDGVDLDLERDQCESQFDTDKLVTPRISGDPREDGESIEVDVTVTPDKNSPMCEPYIEVYRTNSGGGNSILQISATALGDVNARRVGIPIGPENRELPIKLRLEKTQIGKQGTLHATGFFRGRKELSPISVLTSGEEYVFPKQSFPQPTVRVSGSPAKKVAIMFVVDCSNSMKQRILDEGTRLAVATQSLESILGTLLENRDADNDCRIGVLAFSHRVGFRTDKSPEGEYIHSPAYQQWLREHPDEESKTPDDDLEMVVGFNDTTNPLSKELKQKIVDEFKHWRPLGETPLYYAMNEALEAFESIPSDVTKHLIVITDGNDQITLVPDWLKRFRQEPGNIAYGPEQVGSTLRKKYTDVEVSVLGIAMDFFIGQDRISSSAGREIHFDPVKDKRGLIDRIEKALGLGRYTVYDEKKRLPAVEQKVPRICQLEHWDIPEVYEVSMPAWKPVPKPARLFIEGGEAFELVLDAEQGGIVHRRYDPREFLPTTADTADAFVSVYPTRESDRVTFSVTLQNMNEKEFSPRPVGIWATITPVRTEGGDDVGPSYHFFDRQFEARTPVPVLDFTIYAWPAEANWARLELWYRVAKELDPAFEDIKANAEKDLVTPADLKEFQVDGITGITFSVRRAPMETGTGVRVIVNERYDNGGKDIHQTRIMATPPANNIIRSYNREGGLARHVFEYYGANNQNQPGKLLITSRERIQQAYSPLKKPLLVKLPLKQ